jgi:hypothetical protein
MLARHLRTSYSGGVARGYMLAVIAFGGVALALTDSGAAARAPLYTIGPTQSCLTTLANAVAGLPPASPPVPPTLFVYALAHDDISTGEGVGPRPRAHKQLGAWYGGRKYQGILLSFFRSVSDAHASLKTLAWLYGGKLIRNVVVTWDQKSTPSQSVRNTVFGCLRSEVAGGHGLSKRTPPPASLATFAGGWGGHTRGLSIASNGRAGEDADDGCCTRVYQMTFQIRSVTGTLTRATAVYRVMSFRRYDSGVRRLHVGDVGKLLLRNGIVTNTLTRDFFCSDPAWGATGACGA